MKKNKVTKSLWASILSLVLCLSMAVGTTFAWFTDSVTSGVNKIVAGNLDIEVEYSKTGEDNSWATVEAATKLFYDVKLWEPGATSVVYLKLTNKGTLALKYNLKIETTGGDFTNVAGQSKNLKNALKFAQVAGPNLVTYENRDDAVAATSSVSTGLENYAQSNYMSPSAVSYLTLVITMPTTIDNEFNYKTGTTAPEIDLNITLAATQYSSEMDSFDKYYDVTTEPIDIYTVEEFEEAVKQSENNDIINVMVENLELSVSYNDEKTLTIKGCKINKLTANIPKGTIHVYNEVGTVIGANVDLTNSAHLYNKVENLIATAGHFVIEPGASVENVIETPVLDSATAEEKQKAKALVVEIKGSAKNVITADGNPANEAKTIISGTVEKLDVKAIDENVSIVIDGDKAIIKELEAVSSNNELNITGNTKKIEKSNINFKGNDPTLADLILALNSANSKEIPNKITICESTKLGAVDKYISLQGQPTAFNGITTTINLEDTLSVDEDNFDGFNDFGAMRIQNGSNITFTGNENGKYVMSEWDNVYSLIYSEYAFQITFESGTFETAGHLFMGNFMGGDDTSEQYITINGGTFKFIGADKDHLIPFKGSNPNSRALICAAAVPSHITVTGGVFYNCDPTNYVASGYSVHSEPIGNDIIYTVVQN